VNDPHVELRADHQHDPEPVRCQLNTAGLERPENAAIECHGTGGDHRRITLPADLGGESPCFAHLLDDPLA